MFIKDPEWQWEPELLGHEVAHCIWGRYHRGKKFSNLIRSVVQLVRILTCHAGVAGSSPVRPPTFGENYEISCSIVVDKSYWV